MAGATYDLAIVAVAVALAGACSRREGDRMPWAAFAAAGGIRLVAWLLATGTVGYLNGPPYALLYHFQASLNPSASAGKPFIHFVQICNALDVILLGLIAAGLGQLLAPRGDRREA